MIAQLAERAIEAEQDLSQLLNFTVEVAYNSPVDPPTVLFTAGPPSETAIITENTASIVLSTSISGAFEPAGASATFTNQPGESFPLTWFNAAGDSIEKPLNIGTVSGTDTGTLVIPVDSNPAPAGDPVIVSFRAWVKCTNPNGIGTVIIETPDPTIVYVQPPG